MKRIIIGLMLIFLFVGLANAHRVLVGQYWDPEGRDHIYATNFCGNFPHHYEGGYFEKDFGYIYAHQAEETVPVYEYWNSKGKDHFYTTNWNELEGGKNDYIFKKILGFIYPKQKEWTVAVWRYWNQVYCDHYYTTDFFELGLGRYGYTLEGILGYIYPPIEIEYNVEIPWEPEGDLSENNPNFSIWR